MSADFRALCADLLWALENAIRVIYHEDGTKHISTANPIVNRARAALSDEPAVPEGREPVAVTEQPSDEELALIYHDCRRGCEFMDQGGFENAARAVLARWGNPAPTPPADGEVVEVVEWLHTVVAAYKSCRNTDHIWSLSGNGVNARLTVTLLTRATELLQRQVLPEVGE